MKRASLIERMLQRVKKCEAKADWKSTHLYLIMSPSIPQLWMVSLGDAQRSGVVIGSGIELDQMLQPSKQILVWQINR